MNSKRIVLMIIAVAGLIVGCGGDGTDKTKDRFVPDPNEKQVADPKGVGEVRNVDLTDPLVEEMMADGKAIYEMKCSACHKLTDQRVVGPGWAGITNRRRPEWVMNMITNVDMMLEKDPEAQKMLEECLTRMPNQGVSIEEARDLLEFMRKNDMDQVGAKDQAVK